MPKVSIIIPMYNVEKYLKRCIESVLNQTVKNLEIICVNDGSPDNCPQICDEWKEKDNRIVVVHKENGGLSDARNAGLDIAQGEYIAFVDSDDWISIQIYQIMINKCLSNCLDICEVNYLKTIENIENVSNSNEYRIFDTENSLKQLINGYMSQTVWNKLYKKGVIKGIYFEKGKLNEDEFWTYQVFANSKRIGKLNWYGYYYFQRDTSIMGTSYSLRRIDAIEGKKRRLDFIYKNYPNLVGDAKKDLFFNILYQTQLLLLTKNRKIKKKGLRILKEYLRSSGIGFFDLGCNKSVIWIVLSKFSLLLCCKIRNIIHIGL